MGGGKETPRQKMIGMMYLFLTAMLALNVSNEVLEAFTIINEGITSSTKSIANKNDKVYQEFNKKEVSFPQKVKKYNDKAKLVKQKTAELYNQIESLKVEIVKKADGPEGDVNDIVKKDDTNVPAEVMILKKKGKKLKEDLNKLKQFLLTRIVKPEAKGIVQAVKDNLATPDGENRDGKRIPWEVAHFEHSPLVGVVTILSKLQSDVKTVESDVINYLIAAIDAKDYKFDIIEAVITGGSKTVIKGEKYESKIFLAASDSKSKPTIIVNGRPIRLENGKGIYNGPTNTIGPQSYKAVIKFKNPNGVEEQKVISESYNVIAPSVVVAPTKMNVFYVGVDNPIKVSVPGVSSDKIEVSFKNIASNRKAGRDNYVVRPRTPGVKAVVSVYMKNPGGRKFLGSSEFRVKLPPKPVAQVANKESGATVSRNRILAFKRVTATMKDFEFDVKYKITGFTLSYSKRGFQNDKHSKSDRFTGEQLKAIRGLSPGQKISIENIKASGPGGMRITLPSIVYKVR